MTYFSIISCQSTASGVIFGSKLVILTERPFPPELTRYYKESLQQLGNFLTVTVLRYFFRSFLCRLPTRRVPNHGGFGPRLSNSTMFFIPRLIQVRVIREPLGTDSVLKIDLISQIREYLSP